jgi:SAM-dependent methyltransferase
MLDIGCGCGTYAKLFPDAEWTGIEVWEPYVDKFKLRELYKDLHIAYARTFDYSQLGKFDIAFAGDVLEHMTAEEAKDLFEKLQAISDTVIISIPIGHHPQGEYEGNPYERHVVDDWTDEKVREVFGTPKWSKIDGAIGVYVWSTKEYKPKICVYSISKNESKFVKRWSDSAKDADIILLADTGSTDDTVKDRKSVV